MPPVVTPLSKENEKQLENKVMDSLSSSGTEIRKQNEEKVVDAGSSASSQLRDCLLTLQPLESYPEADNVVVYEEKDKHLDELSSLLVKPYIQHQSAKQKKHDEDKIIVVHNVWENAQKQVKVPFSIFGVCDGHGGNYASTMASKRLVYHVQQYLSRLPIWEVIDCDNKEEKEEEKEGESFDDILGEFLDGEDEEEKELSMSIKMQWKVEDEMIKLLPSIMHDAFVKVAEECKQGCPESGTTATLLVMVGWQVVVASVGDSYCFVDNSKQIKMVSSNHRVEDNESERKAVLERGGKVAKEADEDNTPIGPLRVWPGGLQMSRSLGDKGSEPVITPIPDIKVVTIPSSGGRLVVASDGLWDAYKSNPKVAVQQIRGLPAGKAAPKLLASGVRKVGLKDDISILVVDATQDEKGVFGKGEIYDKPVDVMVVDVGKNETRLSMEHIMSVRKQLVYQLKQKRLQEQALIAERSRDEVDSSAVTDQSMEQRQSSSSYEDLSNLKIDVETLQESANSDEWQQTKVRGNRSSVVSRGRGRGRNSYGNGRKLYGNRGRGRNSGVVREREKVESGVSEEEGAQMAPVPSRYEFSAVDVRERMESSTPDSSPTPVAPTTPPSDPFAKFKVNNNQAPESNSTVGQLRPNSSRGRGNSGISSGRGGNSRNVFTRGSNSKDYVVKYQKPNEVVEIDRTHHDVISFQKQDVISVQRPREVVAVQKNPQKKPIGTSFQKNELAKGVFHEENSVSGRSRRSSDHQNNSRVINRGRGRGLNRGAFGRGGNKGPSYTFNDVKNLN